jgi:IS30 family transposase
VKDEVNALLRVQWSPEQIASQLPISHETVYQHVYADKAQGGTLKEPALPKIKEEALCRWPRPARTTPQQTAFERSPLA